jgi:hypothetical protein
MMKTIALLLIAAALCPEALAAKEQGATALLQKEAGKMAGKQALCFMENKGQLTDGRGGLRTDIDFGLSGGGLDLFVGRAGLHYQFHELQAAPLSKAAMMKGGPTAPAAIQAYRMDVRLEGANEHAVPEREEATGYYENYYLPQCPRGVRAYAYEKIRYRDIYPNIDWVLYIRDGQPEYEFVLHEGAKPSDIKLRYEGATSLSLDGEGNLVATTPLGTVTEPAPYCYERSGHEIKGRYVLAGKELRFSTAAYAGELTIDPVLKWGTYYGWTGSGDGFYSVACDPWNYVYTSGITYSTSNIATVGTFAQTIYNSEDGMLIKFDSSGNRIWGTYYGGSDVDYCYDIATDPFGNVFIGGETESQDVLSTPGSHQEVMGGVVDAFVAKFDSTGNRIWGTYYGGTLGDYGFALTSDNEGNVYLGGMAYSPTGISTPGAYKTTLTVNGVVDAFLVKFDSAGVRQWGTYFGGHDVDEILDISYDRNIGGMYICGITTSQDSIATPGAYQTANAGDYDAFVAKFDSTGSLQWGTYFGGSGTDSAGSLVGSEGVIYVSGQTNSTSGIATPGAWQTTYGGGANDAFLARFEPNGNLTWASYYGGAGNETAGEVCVGTGNSAVYTSGGTTSTSGIATPGAYQDTYAGGTNDAYIAKFIDLNTAPALVWASYYSGTGYEPETNVCADGLDNLYFAGMTTSTSNIATVDGFKNYISGYTDAFLVRFRDCEPPAQPDTILGALWLCPGDTEVYSTPVVNNASGYAWVLPPGWTGSSTTNSITVTASDTDGQITVIAQNGCDGSDPTMLTVHVYAAPQPPINDNGGQLSTNSYSSYQWYYNGQPINGATSQDYTATQSGQYYVQVTNANGCTGYSDTIQVWAANVNAMAAGQWQLAVYPNPVKEVLQVGYSNITEGQMELCDMAGKVLIEQPLSHSMDLKGLASGVYMLRVLDKTTGYESVHMVVKE